MPSEPNPVFRPSGISYIRFPAVDPQASAAFYAAVFGWEIHGEPDSPSFTDGTGHVIGNWETDQALTAGDGIRPYVYVDSIEATLEKAKQGGATIAEPPFPEGNLTIALISDPAGNTIGIWTHNQT